MLVISGKILSKLFKKELIEVNGGSGISWVLKLLKATTTELNPKSSEFSPHYFELVARDPKRHYNLDEKAGESPGL